MASLSQLRSRLRVWYIYSLFADDEEVRYVGWTYNPKKRMRKHLHDAKWESRHRDCWIKGVLSRGGRVDFNILEMGTGDGWAAAEQKWIRILRADNFRLTNLTDGGEGIVGYKHSAEQIARQREVVIRCGGAERMRYYAALRRGKPGRKLTAEHIAKLVTCNRERVWTPEMRAKVSTSVTRVQLGRPCAEATKEKIAARHRGRKLTADHVARCRLGKMLAWLWKVRNG